MILIQFPDRDTEVKGLAFLIGRFSGKVMRDRLHIVSESAVKALAAEGIPFVVKGNATYDDQVAAIRGDAATAAK